MCIPTKLALLNDMKIDLRKCLIVNESSQVYSVLVSAFAKRLGVANDQLRGLEEPKPPQAPRLKPRRDPEEPAFLELPAPTLLVM